MWQDFREASGCPLLFKQTLNDLSVLVVAQLYQKEAVLRKNRESWWTLQTEAPKRMHLQLVDFDFLVCTSRTALFRGRLRAFGKCTNGVALPKRRQDLESVRLTV